MPTQNRNIPEFSHDVYFICFAYRVLIALIENAGSCINKVEDAADVLETALEAYFRDIEIGSSREQSPYHVQNTIGTKWNTVISILRFPSRQEKVTIFLEHCISHGHVLLIYAYIKQRRTNGEHCKSIKDEEVLLSSLLDWMRHINLRY